MGNPREERFLAQKTCDGKPYLASRTALGMTANKHHVEMEASGGTLFGALGGGITKEFLEHGAAGEKMQPLFGEFGLGVLRAKDFTSGAEPIEPGGIFGAELFREFLAEALSEGGAFAIGGDGDLEIAALDDGAVVEVAVGGVVDGVAENVAGFGFAEDGGVDFGNGSGGDDKESAGEIAWFVEFGPPVEMVSADLEGEIGIEARGD